MKTITNTATTIPSPKHRVELRKQTNVVYKIPCAQCNWSYIEETGRAFETRKKEHEECKNTRTRRTAQI